MSLLPEKLNNHLTAICLIAGGYAGFRWYQGGGYGWKFVVGVCGYMVASGLWQVWVTRKK
jgi:hypothetical protein